MSSSSKRKDYRYLEDVEELMLDRRLLSQDRGRNREFWSFRILSQILTRERILDALTAEFGEQDPRIPEYVDRIGPVYDDDADVSKKGPYQQPPTGQECYLRIFGILVLLSITPSIVDFIDSGVSDDYLPLSHPPGREPESMGNHPPLSLVPKWSRLRWHQLERAQWQFLTPVFRSNIRPPHYIFSEQIILPWIKADVSSAGAVGAVQRVTIDPGSHEFGEINYLMPISDLAIKSVGDIDYFTTEVENLRRFASHGNPHIVTLLCTFQRDDQYYMIFPWADYNLYEYWKTADGFSRVDVGDQRWILTQLLGLADALNTLHNPQKTTTDNIRHGDIKPENILWFRSSRDPRGILVLADFGLAKYHRVRTKSRERTTENFGFTATYRPPEVDMRGLRSSRSMDIWSLGCVFLEMACWLLGGFGNVEAFCRARVSKSGGIFNTDAFFSLEPGRSDIGDTCIVKPEVLAHIARLHAHRHCTGFIHDLLDLIQHEMLLVDAAKRVQSGALVDRLRHIYNRALNDDRNVYILKPCPFEQPEQPVLTLKGKADEEVRELILKETRARMTQRFSKRGSIRRSIRTKERSMTTNIIQAVKLDVSEAVGHSHPSGNHIPSISILETRQIAVNEVLWADDTTACMQSIDELVRRSLNSSKIDTEVYSVTFDIAWELEQCLRDELDGSLELGSVLTITGNSLHAWATSCSEYIRETWKEQGEQFLIDIEVFIGRKFSITDQQPIGRLRGSFSASTEETLGLSHVAFVGTSAEISILSQILSWIAATFRMPQSGEMACSMIDFKLVSTGEESTAYRIDLINLRKLDDGPGTCWKLLFPSTVMACGFPVASYPGARGLRIPFEAMLEMAEILYDVNLEDDDGKDTGVYFDGVSYTLYPTAYLPEHQVIQWHVESKSDSHERTEHDLAMAPDTGERPKWERIRDLETLRSATAILGYCNEVHIQLGTAARLPYHDNPLPSIAHIERPPLEVSGGSVTAGFSILGFINGSGSTALKTRNGLKRAKEAAKDQDYFQVLETAEKEQVILYDTEAGNERAWMVSEISLILELFNMWAHKRKISNIRYANPSPNGAARPEQY